jgi:hypothetical protein
LRKVTLSASKNAEIQKIIDLHTNKFMDLSVNTSVPEDDEIKKKKIMYDKIRFQPKS